MAIAFGRDLGTGAINTSGTTVVITTTATANVGEWIVVRAAADNLSATTPTFTCADSAGNTYTVDRQDARNATAAAGIAAAVISAPVTTQLSSGGTITVTLSGAVFAKCSVAQAFTGVGGRRASGATSAGGANTTPTVTLTTPVDGDLVVGHIADESRTAPSAYDTDTTNGSWSTGAVHPSATTGTDNQRVQVIYQHKIVTGTGSQTIDCTKTTSADWLALLVAYTPTIEGTAAVTLGAFTSTASGTLTFTGTSAVTLDAFTSSASGTFTGTGVTGTAAVTLAAFVSTADGTYTPPAITGTAAVTLGAFTTTTTGTFQVNITGTSAVTLGAFTSTASGTVINPITGTAAVTLGPFTTATTGLFQVNITGTAAPVLGAFTSTASGTFIAAITGTSAVTLGTFAPTASGTYTPPAITGTAAITLGPFTSTGMGFPGELPFFDVSVGTVARGLTEPGSRLAVVTGGGGATINVEGA